MRVSWMSFLCPSESPGHSLHLDPAKETGLLTWERDEVFPPPPGSLLCLQQILALASQLFLKARSSLQLPNCSLPHPAGLGVMGLPGAASPRVVPRSSLVPLNLASPLTRTSY